MDDQGDLTAGSISNVEVREHGVRHLRQTSAATNRVKPSLFVMAVLASWVHFEYEGLTHRVEPTGEQGRGRRSRTQARHGRNVGTVVTIKHRLDAVTYKPRESTPLKRAGTLGLPLAPSRLQAATVPQLDRLFHIVLGRFHLEVDRDVIAT